MAIATERYPWTPASTAKPNEGRKLCRERDKFERRCTLADGHAETHALVVGTWNGTERCLSRNGDDRCRFSRGHEGMHGVYDESRGNGFSQW